MNIKDDHGLKNLLHLDGDRYFIDENGQYEVCFSAKKTKVSTEKPYGISYSLVVLALACFAFERKEFY